MKKILILIDWFYPAFKAGGPIQSCRNIMLNLSDQYDFYLYTSDRDLGDKMPFKGVIQDEWVKQGDGCFIRYCSKSSATAEGLKKVIREVQPDIIYLNSLFSFRYTLLPLYVMKKMRYANKIIIAPRGMLHAGAMRYKSFKKRAFLFLFSWLYSNKNMLFHATDKQEAEDITKYIGKKMPVRIVENIPYMDKSPLPLKPKEKKVVRCIFASRLHPKKNLLFALEVLRDLTDDAKVEFDIYGPVDDQEYMMRCVHKSTRLPENVIVKFCGPVPHSELSEKLKEYHLFFLPTRGENFGHVIFEAMAAGCIALISDQTPWTDIEDHRAGWSLPLNSKRHFAEKIKTVCEMDSEAYLTMAQNAKEYAKTYYRKLNFKQRYFELFG